jgi:branched-chain amino acid aminotransferase
MPAASNISLYGKGVFTTVAIRDGRPFLWDKHWRRLCGNANTVGIDLFAFPEELIQNQLARSIENDSVQNGRARVTFFDESPSPIWPSEERAKTSLLISTGDVRSMPDNFQLTDSPYTVNSRSPLAGVKSCNYLEKLMAMDEARERGFDEAIQVNTRGNVTSATMANVFWLKDDQLYTPSLTTGCLPGTTREYVLENLECREVEAGIEELTFADAIYLTSAGLGITSVAEYNGRKLQDSPHPITQLLTMN